jgi:hypothetical protein
LGLFFTGNYRTVVLCLGNVTCLRHKKQLVAVHNNQHFFLRIVVGQLQGAIFRPYLAICHFINRNRNIHKYAPLLKINRTDNEYVLGKTEQYIPENVFVKFPQ